MNEVPREEKMIRSYSPGCWRGALSEDCTNFYRGNFLGENIINKNELNCNFAFLTTCSSAIPNEVISHQWKKGMVKYFGHGRINSMNFVFFYGRGWDISSFSWKPVFIYMDTLTKQTRNAQASAQNARRDIRISLGTYEVKEMGLKTKYVTEQFLWWYTPKNAF